MRRLKRQVDLIRCLGSGLAIVSLAGCGGSAPPPPGAPKTVVVPPPVEAPGGTPATADVAPPDDLFLTAVLVRPEKSFDALSALLQGTRAWRKTIAVIDVFGGREIASSLDFTSPVMAAAAGEKVAGSVAVKAGAASRLAERLRMEPTKSGGFRTRPPVDKASGGSDADDSPLPFPCLVTPPGVQGQRLVCGTDKDAVDSLGPVLARLKADEHGADLHLEMGAEKIRQAMIDGAKKDGEPATKATALGRSMVTDFANDLDALTLDVSLTGAVDATLGVRFRGEKSVFTRLITRHPDRAAPPGSAFWHLPKDANVAIFSQGADPSDLEGVRTLVFGGLEDSMKDDTCPEEVTYVAERLRALFLTGGPFVVGVGNDVDGAGKAVTAFRALPKENDAAKAHTRIALENWMLVEVDEPASKWITGTRELALADKRFAKCKAPTPAADKDKPKDHTTTDVAPVAASAHLPKGTLHLVSHTVPAAKSGKLAHSMHLFVIPEGEHTWFAVGENEAMVTAKARAALKDAPIDGTLEGRPVLELLRSANVLGGGFVTIEGVTLLGVDDDTSDQMKGADKQLSTLASLPSKGTAPIPLTWRASSKDASTRVVLPRAALTEILSLVAP